MQACMFYSPISSNLLTTCEHLAGGFRVGYVAVTDDGSYRTCPCSVHTNNMVGIATTHNVRTTTNFSHKHARLHTYIRSPIHACLHAYFLRPCHPHTYFCIFWETLHTCMLAYYRLPSVFTRKQPPNGQACSVSAMFLQDVAPSSSNLCRARSLLVFSTFQTMKAQNHSYRLSAGLEAGDQHTSSLSTTRTGALSRHTLRKESGFLRVILPRAHTEAAQGHAARLFTRLSRIHST
jgi:hypothetical protein